MLLEQRKDASGSRRRGIVRVTRHPFLTGVGLWALVHLIGNGDVASLFFFATWAIVALAGTASIDAKRRRLLGANDAGAGLEPVDRLAVAFAVGVVHRAEQWGARANSNSTMASVRRG